MSELREVTLTSYLFDGYPAAIEGFIMLSEMYPESVANSVSIEYSYQDIERWRQQGTKLCQQIYGKQFLPLMNHMNNFAPELRESMIVEGYGKVLARQGLDIMYRELCIVSMLTLKLRLRQLRSHMLGALRVGADADHLDTALSIASEFLPENKMLKCRNTLSEAVAAHSVP